MEEKSYVFNIQRYSLHDGPGIRTIIFLKGCPMRCRWCCNPESQERKPEIFYTESKCIGLDECGFCKNICPNKAISFKGKAVIDRERCTNCLKCEEVCPSKAIKVQGEEYSIDRLLDIAEKDSIFYGSQGGLTVSGGEPLSHGAFLIRLLKEAKKRRVNTAMETCGYGGYEILYEAAKQLDYILYDIKTLNCEKHREYTGCDNEPILNNFKRLCGDFPNLKKRVRTPVIPGFNDSPEDIRDILDFIKDLPNVSYEPLKYHSFGRGKYASLGREYELGDIALDENTFEEITDIVKKAGF